MSNLLFRIAFLSLTSGAASQANVGFEPLVGSVLDRHGKPVQGANVRILRAESEGFSCLDLPYSWERRLVARMRTTRGSRGGAEAAVPKLWARE